MDADTPLHDQLEAMRPALLCFSLLQLRDAALAEDPVQDALLAVLMVLEGLDRALSIIERSRMRLHLLVCGACSRFQDQMDLLRGAMRAAG